MTLLQGVLGARNSLENPLVPLTSTTLLDFLGIEKSYSGKSVTEASSLGMPAIWRAVNLIAGTAASLPLHAFAKDDLDRKQLTTGPAATLLATPHPDMTSLELWETIYAHMLLWGNAYLRTLRNPVGQVTELWPIHPSRVKVGRTTDTGRKIYEIDSGKEEHDDTTILHMPAFGYDGVCGVSPIRVARQGIGLALAAEEYGAKLFGSGSLATGILQTEQRLDQTQADALQSRWKAKRSGLDSAHSTIVLDSGAKFQQLSIPPEDAQFIESRRFQISEVARMFGVPPHMLMDTEKSTSWGTGIEQQGIGFVVYTLRPWLSRVEQRLTRLVNPQAANRKPATTYVHYSVEGLLRGDIKSRYEAYAIGRNWGWLSTNTINRLEELPPVEGGDDDFLVPLNMKPMQSEATLNQRIEAATALIRAGFFPDAALVAVGLDPIEHTGLVPITVNEPEAAADPALAEGAVS